MIQHYNDYIFRWQKHYHWYLWRNAQIFTPTSDAFGYNERSEVVFSRGDAEDAEYSYDEIGNLVARSSASITNQYVANNLNQYATILRASATPREINPQCDIDGNLLSDGTYSFTYDSANRLKTVSSIKYYWGKDLSGSLQGAGAIGGMLLWMALDSCWQTRPA